VYVFVVCPHRLCHVLRCTSRGTLGAIVFNIFINDLCDVINYSDCTIYNDGLKVYGALKSHSACSLLQSEIVCVHNWCSAHFMKLKSNKIRAAILPIYSR
jgi:hypothetical protein